MTYHIFGACLCAFGICVLIFALVRNYLQRSRFRAQAEKSKYDALSLSLREMIRRKLYYSVLYKSNPNKVAFVAESLTYQSEKEVLADCKLLFPEQIYSLQQKYPALTDSDWLVLLLLGMGMDNTEICTLLTMKKKTLYRRRQLIADRLNISSLQVDDFATNALA